MGDIIVDKEYEYLLKKHSWYLKDGLYPQTTINNKNVYIYHIILNTNDLVDHIDRNPLNNRKNNLRLVSKSQNAMNSKKRIDNSSGIKGVSFNKSRNKYETYINIKGKRIRLGKFDNIKDAALKRIEAEKLYFGDFMNKELIKEMEEKYG